MMLVAGGLLAGLLPPGARAFECWGAPEASLGHPCDLVHAARFAPARRMTFLAGRACARAALTRLGREGGPLAPCRAVGVHWPVGVVGSITHTSGYAAAAVMAAADGHIGIDAEHVGRIAPSLWPAFLTQAEQAELDRAPPAVRQVRAAIAFSAKEAVYKAFRAGGGPRLGFSDVEIAISADGFAPRFRGVDGPPGHGRFQRHGDLILSAVVLGRL